MPLVDELRQIEQRVTRRLKELEPLVAEYRQLREIAERLGGEVARAARAPAAAAMRGATAVQRKRPGRARATRAPAASAAPTPSASAPAAPEAGAAARRSAGARPATAGTRRAAAKPTAAAKRAAAAKPTPDGRAGGKHDQDIIRMVNKQPGITVAEVGRQLGVHPTGLYRVVRRLEAQGQIIKQGAGLKPAAK